MGVSENNILCGKDLNLTLLKYIFFFLIILSQPSCTAYKPLYQKDGQLLGILPLLDGKVIYRQQYELAGLAKEDILGRLSRWYRLIYSSSKESLQVATDGGSIAGKGNAKIHIKSANVMVASHYQLTYLIRVTFGKSGYEVSLTELSFFLPAVNMYTPARVIPLENYNLGTEKTLLALFHGVDETLRQTLTNLHQFIQKPTP